jgi:protoporphyrinogen/coproporphyrinogen III oxidase
MTQPRHVVVVGGGVSGLAAAWELSALPGVRVTVLEGSARVGGKVIGGEVAGIAVDLGAESVLARRPEAVELIGAVGLADEVVHPATTSAGLWTAGRIVPVPPTVMGVPADLAAARDVLGAEGVRRAEAEGADAPGLEDDVPIGAFVASRMGRTVTDRLVDPLLGGVYAGRADEISLAAAVPELFARLRTAPSLREAAASMRGQRTGTDQPVFAGLRGGVHRLVEQLASELGKRGAEIRTRSTVRRITRSDRGFRLETGPVPEPRFVTADAVVMATPARPAARMLTEIVPVAASELAAIEYASLAIVTLAVRRADWPAGATGSGFLVPSVEGRTIKAATYTHQKWAHDDDIAVFRCSVGRLGEEYVLQRDDSELVAAATEDLRAAIGLDTAIVDSVVQRWGGALPQYAVGHLDRISRVERAVEEVPGLAVAGAAYQGVGIAACVASGQRAATRVRAELDRLATMTP